MRQKSEYAEAEHTVNGETRTLREWAARLGMSPRAVHERITRGWTVESALTTPPLDARSGGARFFGAKPLSDEDRELVMAIKEDRRRMAARICDIDIERKRLMRERNRLSRKVREISDKALAEKFEVTTTQIRRAER